MEGRTSPRDRAMVIAPAARAPSECIGRPGRAAPSTRLARVARVARVAPTAWIGRVARMAPAALFAVAALALGAAACETARASTRPLDVVGDAQRGKGLFDDYGCTSCHIIPGVADAGGTVGPPLIAWQRRTYIAGMLPNTPGYLVRWIMTPQQVVPGNAMPDMGVSQKDASDMAAYLYTIKSATPRPHVPAARSHAAAPATGGGPATNLNGRARAWPGSVHGRGHVPGPEP